MVECRRCSVILLLKIIIVFQSVSAQYDHKHGAIAVANNTSDSLRNARENILLFYREKMNGESHRNRVKRYDASVFRGHQKTREERWHTNFKSNGSNLEMEQTHSLVILLNKIVDKYLNACIPIILYDKYVESSDSVILQTFFQVTTNEHHIHLSLQWHHFPSQSLKISYLHGKIDANYSVINRNLLFPYDRKCRSYILFLSDAGRARDVLGPQTDNRVVLIPRSTQWKLQEFLASKAASDIINLLVIGESLSTDDAKVRWILNQQSIGSGFMRVCVFDFSRKNRMFCTRIDCTPTVLVQIYPSFSHRGLKGNYRGLTLICIPWNSKKVLPAIGSQWLRYISRHSLLKSFPRTVWVIFESIGMDWK